MTEGLLSDSGFLLSLRWVLAAVILVAVYHKLRSPASFVVILDDYRLLPRFLLVPFAGLLIIAELLTAGLLLLNSMPGGAIALGLFTLYTVAITLNLLRGRRDIDCGCAGPAVRQTLSGWLVVRNVCLILVTLLTLAPSSRGLVILDWFTAFAAALTFALLYLTASFLVALPARPEH